MCRRLIEIHYLACQHTSSWEVSSHDPNCNGILHHLTETALKPCKHCWVAQGRQKARWRRAALLDDLEKRHMAFKRQHFTMVYPIQGAGLRRSSECPTWKRHYAWNTRAWAFRELAFQREDNFKDHEFEVANKPHLPFYSIDTDSPENRLFRIVEPENLTDGQDRCSICWGNFVSDDPLSRCRAAEAGEGYVRQLPCAYGHAFCVQCIREQFVAIAEDQERAIKEGRNPSEHRCPFCNVSWDVTIYQARDMKSRFRYIVHALRLRMNRSFVPSNHDLDEEELAKVGSISEFYGCLAILLFCMPTFHTVCNTMDVWGSKTGKLPASQVAVVFVAGVVLQATWFVALSLVPHIIIGYLTRRFVLRVIRYAM